MNTLISVQNGKITAREMYDFLQLHPAAFARWAKSNIEDNEFYEEGQDWWGFNIVLNGNEVKDYQLTLEFAKHLSMMSRSERGKQARQYFVEMERQVIQNNLPQMTQTQLIAALAQQAVEQEQKLAAIQEQTANMDRRLTIVKDTIIQRDDNWRDTMNAMVNKIVKYSGKTYQDVRTEAYSVLEERAACDLNARLRNLKQRYFDRGETKTKINSLTRMDVIEQDKRLKEIFSAIVRELTIKFVA